MPNVDSPGAARARAPSVSAVAAARRDRRSGQVAAQRATDDLFNDTQARRQRPAVRRTGPVMLAEHVYAQGRASSAGTRRRRRQRACNRHRPGPAQRRAHPAEGRVPGADGLPAANGHRRVTHGDQRSPGAGHPDDGATASGDGARLRHRGVQVGPVGVQRAQQAVRQDDQRRAAGGARARQPTRSTLRSSRSGRWPVAVVTVAVERPGSAGCSARCSSRWSCWTTDDAGSSSGSTSCRSAARTVGVVDPDHQAGR